MPDTPTRPTIGILGAGKVGTVLARLAVAAGHPVVISGSGSPSAISLIVDVLAPGATAATSASVIEQSDVVILAFPLGKLHSIPPDALAGKLVLDAMNYWRDIDGDRADLQDYTTTTSAIVQHYFASARIVKAFNHMGYHDLDESARPKSAPDRAAIAIAGDDPAGLRRAAAVIDELGFDPVEAGGLAEGVRLEPGSEIFGARLSASELRAALDRFPHSEHGRRVAAGRSQQPAETR
jgi:predicted dinucleotide-binding enzyme